MSRPEGSKTKGAFGSALLAVSQKYIIPRSRKDMMRYGMLGVAALLVFVLADAFLFGKGFISSGELSSKHAMIGDDCGRCHETAKGVTSALCSSCHEKAGDATGMYSYSAHYLYRTDDRGRIAKGRDEHMGDEQACKHCHPEHQGREAQLTKVTDAMCIACHPGTSFPGDHPEFDFARRSLPDDSSMAFTHIRHTDFVVKKLSKERGSALIEESCLYCHVAQADGKSFKPLNYDTQCAECHLTSDVKTASVPVTVPGIPFFAGVETVEMIRQRGGPGTRWAFYANPNEYLLRGDRISKSPVYHKDPWVLENLAQIRAMLYTGDDGLADVLQAFGATTLPQTRQRYLEVIAKLEQYALELRARPEPEVQSDLATINNALRLLRAKVERGQGLLSEDALSLSSLKANPNITPAQRGELEKLAQDFTSVCRVCHTVANAGMQRVAQDQRILRRAEFSHKAHILDRRCLECHTAIPVTKEMAGDKKVSALADRAAVQNIPGKANCAECHTSSKASNSCVSCHRFHPETGVRGNLRLFVDR